MREPSYEDFIKAIAKEPALTIYGLERIINIEEYRRSRDLLKDRFIEFQISCDWLSRCPRRKTVNSRIGNSFGLKDRVQAWAGELISNGAFIAAVIHLGIPYKLHKKTPNVFIGLSSRCAMLN